MGALGRRLDAAIAEALGPEKMGELKQVAESIKKEEAQKASRDDPALQEAIEECKKSCTKASVEDHTCAQTDICCAAYGNSKCIRMPGQPSFAEQQTGVGHFSELITFFTSLLRFFHCFSKHARGLSKHLLLECRTPLPSLWNTCRAPFLYLGHLFERGHRRRWRCSQNRGVPLAALRCWPRSARDAVSEAVGGDLPTEAAQ